jgi:hypothetical protein
MNLNNIISGQTLIAIDAIQIKNEIEMNRNESNLTQMTNLKQINEDRPSSYCAQDLNKISIIPPLNTSNSGFFVIESVTNEKSNLNDISTIQEQTFSGLQDYRLNQKKID